MFFSRSNTQQVHKDAYLLRIFYAESRDYMKATEAALKLESYSSSQVETDVFADNAEAKFWLGIVASHDIVTRPHDYLGARILRANVYIDDCGFLPSHVRQSDGGESDADDKRSTHFAVIENVSQHQRDLVGNLRLITKDSEVDLLPVERLFPEAFLDGPAPLSAGEASRFIARHPDKLTQGAISISLIRAAAQHAINVHRQPVYAIVEEPLQRRFSKIGMPHEVIAEPRPLEEYNNTLNMAIKFEPHEVYAAAQADTESALLMTPFFRTVEQNNGVGLYGDYLLEPLS